MLGVILCDDEKESLRTYSHEIKWVVERDRLDAEVLLSTTDPNAKRTI